MPKEVVIKISPAGNTEIEAIGFQGVGCADATQQIELVLGGGEAKSQKDPKPEFYSPETTCQPTKMTF